MVSNSTVSYRKIVGERKHQFMQQTSLLSYFKKLPQPCQTSAASTLICQQASTSRQEPLLAKLSQFAEDSDAGWACLVAQMVTNPPATSNPGSGSIPRLGRSPGEGNGNPLQYSCLANPEGRGTWRAAVHGVTENRTRLSD